jgi:copper transport protein
MRGIERGRRAGGPVALILLMSLFLPARLAAHANLVRAEPDVDAVVRQAPNWLRLWFSEPMEADFSAVTLRSADGTEVPGVSSRVTPANPREMEVTLPTLAPGSYVVAWRTLSTLDGHTARGSYSLRIGEAAASAEPVATTPPAEATGGTPWEALARWLGAFGLALVLGGLVFRAWVLTPALPDHRSAAALAAADRRLARLLVAGWILLLTATLAQLVLQLQAAGGSPPAFLFATRAGRLWLLRLGLVAALGMVVDTGRRVGWRQLAWPGVALAGGISLLASLNSHAAAVTPGSDVAVAADWLHIMAVATWIGGLVALVSLLPAAVAALAPSDQAAARAQAVGRFSALAIGCVAVMLGSGLYLAWVHVGGIAPLTGTLYGLSLGVKLVLVLPLLALGAFNLLYARPRLTRAAARDPASDGTAGQSGRPLQRAARGEILLGVLVLLTAGWVASLPPARGTYATGAAHRPLPLRGQSADLAVGLDVAQPAASAGQLDVLLHDAAGQPVDDAERVDLRVTYLDDELGTRSVTAQPTGAGRYTVRGPYLTLDGNWQAEVVVRRRGLDDARAAFRFQIAGGRARPENGSTVDEVLPLPELQLLPLLVLAVLAAGAIVLADALRRGRLASRGGAGVLLAALVVFALGALLSARLWQPPDTAQDNGDLTAPFRRNPFAPDALSLATGRTVYEARCVICHGANGHGDGPAAATLNPAPADFRVHMAAGHTDAQLFQWLSDGVSGTAMPAFAAQLSEADRWHVINYIRGFASY